MSKKHGTTKVRSHTQRQVIPGALTFEEALNVLKIRSRQLFYQCGLDKVLHHYVTPSGKEAALYSSPDVEELAAALDRRRAMIAFGELSHTSPVIDAVTLDRTRDTKCPRCGGWAYSGQIDLAWCPECNKILDTRNLPTWIDVVK